MIKTFYLVRHAETDWNKQGKLQGHSDIPLSPIGVAQAQKLAPVLQKLKPEIIYSSPLQRALQTAQGACLLNPVPILTDRRLMEVALGDVEGFTESEIFAKYGENSLNRWRNLDWSDDFTFPGGESKIPSVQRFHEFLCQDFTHNKLLIMSHGLILRRFLGSITEDPDFPKITNTCVLELSYDTDLKKFEFQGIVYQLPLVPI